MKIIITNTVALNGGDAAILEGILEILYSAFGKDTEFVVYDSQPTIVQKYYPNLKFKETLYFHFFGKTRRKSSKRYQRVINDLSMFFNTLRIYLAAWFLRLDLYFFPKLILSKIEMDSLAEYKSANVIVSTGGTYLVENYNLEPRVFDFDLSLKIGKPLILFTQSIGPITDPKYRKSLKYIFEKSSLILLRDNSSQENILNFDVKANSYVASDAAFALAQPKLLEVAKSTSRDLTNPNIAISVRDWKYFKVIDPKYGREKYLQSLRDLTSYLVEKYSAKIVYISTCQGIPDYWTDDSEFALEIIDSLPNHITDSVYVDREFHSPCNLMKKIKDFDFVIATRLHMAILALNVGVPVLPISYEFKTKALFQKFELDKFTIDIEDINSFSLIDVTDQFITAIPEICDTLFSSILTERENALRSRFLVMDALAKL